MTDKSQWIAADQVFDGVTLHKDHAIQLQDHRCTDLKPTKDLHPDMITGHHNGLISPGFIDIQVNGGGGVMFNNTPTPAGIAAIAAAHRSFGTIGICPTVITDSPTVLEAAVAAALDARDLPALTGLHIEGPHIATARRGTHAARFIRPMDDTTLALVRILRDGNMPTLITLAPENTTNAQITKLRDMGAVVAIGHSDATADDTQAAITAGASCFTHLFNAMSPMTSRAPGVTGTAINSDLWCSVIADGIHVDPQMLALAIRARPTADRMIAVSDAMATIGGPDHFALYGQIISLDAGRLVNAEGALAGAHLTMLAALQNLVTYAVGLETALKMCRSNPLTLLGQEDRVALVGLHTSDILGFNRDLQLIKCNFVDPVISS